MASAFTKHGVILRRTKLMPITRAKAFARMLAANSRLQIGEPVVKPEGVALARVEWYPARPQTVSRLREGLQAVRRIKAENDVRRYKWRRFGPRRWHCSSPQGRCYSIWLDRPQCTCPDWDRMHSLGLKCKHYICAEEAERRYQAHINKERKAA